MKKKIIGLNWKMNPGTLREATALMRLTKTIRKHDAVVFPPFVFIPDVSKEVRLPKGRRTSFGVQNFSPEKDGAHTGEVSLSMLKSLGVKYALVGHSEVRAAGETDALIAKKLKAALAAGMIPVLCVGEPWSVRKKGPRAAEAYVKKQITNAFKEVPLPKGRTTFLKAINPVIVAYEPVWAIGTGRACSPEDAVKMAKFIKRTLEDALPRGRTTSKVLYGGSVDAKNIASFLVRKEIDGALVGGASSDLKKSRALVRVLK